MTGAAASGLTRLAAAGRSPLLPLMVVVFCVNAGMGMVWSVLAVYTQSMGASTTLVGAMIASFGGARLVTNLPAGVISERFGRRPVMLAGLGVLALGSFAGAATASLPALFLCLLVQGAGSAVYVTATLSAVADLGNSETRVRDMALYQAANLVGLSLGPGLGGLAASAWGYTAPFFLQGGTALVAAVALGLFGLRRGGAAAPRSAPRQDRAAAGFLGRIWPVMVMAYGVFGIRIAGNWVLLPLVAQQALDLSVGTIGLMLTLGAIANLAVLPLTTWGARRLGRRSVVVGSTLLTIAALGLLGATASVPMAWCAALLLGAGSGMAMPALSAYAADIAPPGRTGAAMGLLRTAMDVAIITGPVGAGALVDHLGWGYEGGLLGCALLLALATALFALGTRRLAARSAEARS